MHTNATAAGQAHSRVETHHSRGLILLAQGVFFNFYFFSYLFSPVTCHRFIGYLEEEAVRTYTHLLEDLETNPELAHWSTDTAPGVAIEYWRLPKTATLKDVVAAVRADEAWYVLARASNSCCCAHVPSCKADDATSHAHTHSHSHVNHTFAGIPRKAPNPFGVGDHDFDRSDFTKPRTSG